MSKNPKSLRGLFRTKKDWTQGQYARNITGATVGITDPDAVQFCLVGGLKRVYGITGEDYRQARQRLEKVIGRRYSNNVIEFNDAKRRKFADIQRLIRLAKV